MVMWIGKRAQAMIDGLIYREADMRQSVNVLSVELRRIEAENVKLQSHIDWFKLRLNAVEKERAQLIAAAIGVKISIPEFVPAADRVEDALNEMQNLSTVGGDAAEEDEHGRPRTGNDGGADYSQMPGYRKQK
jgi:hypothetical protein